VKLRYSTTSPFVRKVVVSALERGLDGRIERVMTKTAPTAPDRELSRDNPLAKLPALVRDDGVVLYDSRVICEYLDSLHQGDKLIPPTGEARWSVLRRQALADGLLDAGVLVLYESRRPADKQYDDWKRGQLVKVHQALDAFEREAASLTQKPQLDDIALACALGWLEFRKVAGDLRPTRPRLFAWYEAFTRRPSMLATAPHES
jgi:glutathione S-transferase